MSPRIRKMSEADLDEVLRIENILFSDPWCRDMYLEEIRNFDSWVLENPADGTIIGFLTGWQIEDEYHITNVGIEPNHQRQGFAKLLITAVIETRRTGISMIPGYEVPAGAPSCSLFILEVRASNTPAITLYESFGFTHLYTRKRYYQHPVEDALVMCLTLSTGEKETTE